MTFRCTIPFRVASLQERSLALRAYVKDGAVKVERENLGWFLTLIPGNISFFIGMDPPEELIESSPNGKEVKLTLEIE